MSNSHSDRRHSHDDDHHKPEMSGRKIFSVTILNLIITLAELVGGYFSGSLALLSDSLHNFSDTVAISLSYAAYKLGQRPKNARKTFGYKRAEILAAFVNASILVGISLLLIIEAIRRWQKPDSINSDLMIIVAVIGLAANLLSVILLHRDAHGNLNIRSSYLHLLGDTISSVGVVIGGIVIKLWNVAWVDPLVTILISVYIVKEAASIIKVTISILMQESADLDYDQIRQDIEGIEHVHNIHHIHSWMINEKTIHFEAHLDVDDMSLCHVQPIYDQIEKLLADKYGIDHVTLQAEVDKCKNKSMF